jgi:amino acid adenylation domain-containing protein
MKNELTQWLNDLAIYAQRESRRPAVLGNDTQLSYGELESEVNVLVGLLQAANIVQGTHIAVCLDRSPHAIVAFLAVLRLGAVYLPIDPQYFGPRLQMILDCKPAALITTSELEKSLGELNCTVFKIDKPLPCEPDKKMEIPALMPDDAPAYLLFTSGSSGSPRAVVVSRGALVRYSNTIRNALELNPSDVYLHSASFSFSASIRQQVAPLGAKATIVIADESALRDPVELLDQMNRCGVTVWDTVPSPWRAVEQTLSKIGHRSENLAISSQLRLVTLTGEPLQWELVRAWRGHLGNEVKIVNLYSQTETAGTVAMYPIPARDIPKTGTVPLGTPLADTQILLRSENNCLTPPGQEGEIYVANDRLAEGYLGPGQPSAGHFLSGTEVDCDFKCVYRTGDFAFIDSQGLLVPTGRHDYRVKIRGFRVDLLEVEAALLCDPLIRQAVALAYPPNRLLAYAVPMNNKPLDTSSVRKRLGVLLPEYAVPAKITSVAALPLLASGKLDRQALALLPALD